MAATMHSVQWRNKCQRVQNINLETQTKIQFKNLAIKCKVKSV